MKNISTCVKQLEKKMIIEWQGKYRVIDSFMYVTTIDEQDKVTVTELPIDAKTGEVINTDVSTLEELCTLKYEIIAQGEYIKDINYLFNTFQITTKGNNVSGEYPDCQTIYNYLKMFQEAGYDPEIPECEECFGLEISLHYTMDENFPISVDIDYPDGYCPGGGYGLQTSRSRIMS